MVDFDSLKGLHPAERLEKLKKLEEERKKKQEQEEEEEKEVKRLLEDTLLELEEKEEESLPDGLIIEPPEEEIHDLETSVEELQPEVAPPDQVQYKPFTQALEDATSLLEKYSNYVSAYGGLYPEQQAALSQALDTAYEAKKTFEKIGQTYNSREQEEIRSKIQGILSLTDRFNYERGDLRKDYSP